MAMKLSTTCKRIGVLAITLAAAFALAPVLRAQQSDKPAAPPQDQTAKPELPGLPAASDVTKPQTEPPKVNPQEEADYKTFYATKPDALDTQIQLGEKFLATYPESKYTEVVNARLVQDYYLKQDLKNLFAAADKALALNSDNVDVLVLVGWLIPRSYDPTSPESAQQLAKAERYEKRVLELLPTVQKQPGITDAQFAAAKAMYQSQAHSGLGLVYFRRQNYADSATELQQAIAAAASPDPADYYVSGIDLERLNRSGEAADAFLKCSQIDGPLQGRCKQLSDEVKKQAASAPASSTPTPTPAKP
jgi:tetratricopeptide (TPR) repeat protein